MRMSLFWHFRHSVFSDAHFTLLFYKPLRVYRYFFIVSSCEYDGDDDDDYGDDDA